MYKDKIEGIIDKVVNAFSGITGIDAVVLSGSRCTGTANEHSDIDIGIYYDESSFDIESLKVKACAIDDERRNGVITSLGEWGPWINGGGWLKVDGALCHFLHPVGDFHAKQGKSRSQNIFCKDDQSYP